MFHGNHLFKRPCVRACLFLAILSGGFPFATLQAGDQQTTFERVFGAPAEFDLAMVEKVKALPPGERLLVDRDGDGKHEEAWFIDTAARHTPERRPILVRVIDEDGDLDQVGPDLDSDIYFADWGADGVIDGVVDYQDNDGDGDVDEMGVYFGEYQQPWIDKNKMKVWWSRDVGDDNLLWYDVDWNYEQDACQYRSHFSGDEVFYQFSLAKDADEWLGVFEDPFAFYDPDGDGASEVTVRICASGTKVTSLRYSMDVDNDARGRHTHDYDFSITALPGPKAITTGQDVTAAFQLRGIPVHPVLRWEQARQFAREANWGNVLLTWDEMNANTEADIDRDPHERWEGVINHASSSFPAVGAPPASTLNKRNEVAKSPAAPLRLYFDATDHRLHLWGAGNGWLDVDADLNGKIDARYTYQDDDGDGVFDRRQLDLDGDGEAEFDWPMQSQGVREFELECEPLQAFYTQSLTTTLTDSQAFIDAAKTVLPDHPQDPIEAFFLERLADWAPATHLGERMRSTPAGARFYLDLIRDRLFLALSRRFGDNAAWNEIQRQYQAGAYAAAASLVKQLDASAESQSVAGFRSFTRRIPLEIPDPGKQRDHWPVVLSVRKLQQNDPKFDPQQCAVVAPERWIDWRQVPHQVDQIDDRVGVEISFLADVPGDASATYYLYYAPTDDETASFPNRTGAAEDWVPPNIGWESNRCAYRAYWGQIDFFGKKTEQLIYHNIGAKSYHQEVEWGIDALHVGTAAGLGGLTLYRADQAWPVRNPAGVGNVEFSKQILVQGPVRCAIQMVAKNVIPEQPNLAVRMRCLIYHEHQETEIRADLIGGATVSADAQQFDLAPGIIKLPRQSTFDATDSGCYGTWGWQEDAIGEIGMGVVVAPDLVKDVQLLADERRIRCSLSPGGELKYWVIGDWRRGRQYPIAPTVENWRRELEGLAELLLHDKNVKIGQPEDAP